MIIGVAEIGENGLDISILFNYYGLTSMACGIFKNMFLISVLGNRLGPVSGSKSSAFSMMDFILFLFLLYSPFLFLLISALLDNC